MGAACINGKKAIACASIDNYWRVDSNRIFVGTDGTTSQTKGTIRGT
jgi:hypothetical protein